MWDGGPSGFALGRPRSLGPLQASKVYVPLQLWVLLVELRHVGEGRDAHLWSTYLVPGGKFQKVLLVGLQMD